MTDEGIFGVDEVKGGTVEDDFSLVEDEEIGVRFGFAFWQGLDAFALVGVAVRGKHEGVLEAVGHEQGCGVVGVALLEDELDDGGGGDGVEPSGG